MPIPTFSEWEAIIKANPELGRFSARLAPIGEEIKLYEKAHSPMAKRNLALGIHQKFAVFEGIWRSLNSGTPVPTALAEVDAAARDEAEIAGSTHKYDYVSCIGYGVHTAKFDERVFLAYWNGQEFKATPLVAYSGEHTDRADYLAKCSRMKDAIKTAYQLYQSEYGSDPRNAKTLKLFMAPEFYFRGRQGAYDIELVSEIFEHLREFTQADIYRDWLFVLGTVIAASMEHQIACRSCDTTGAKNFKRNGLNDFSCQSCPQGGTVYEKLVGARIDNAALIQKGGEADDKNAYVLLKEYVSHIDFRRSINRQRPGRGAGDRRAALVPTWQEDRTISVMNERVKALPPGGSRDMLGDTSAFTDERMGGSEFTIDGIKFGLEICVDHGYGRLKSGSGIQVQLVPSAGQHLQQFACVEHGIAFNVDGGDGMIDVRINNAGGKVDWSLSPASKTRSVISAPNRGTSSQPGRRNRAVAMGADAHGWPVKVFEPRRIPYPG